jgi:hypothetical protein
MDSLQLQTYEADMTRQLPASGKQASHVTLEQVAQRTGVSRSAVSKVLLGRDGVSHAMTQRVLVAARELGYEKPLHHNGSGG